MNASEKQLWALMYAASWSDQISADRAEFNRTRGTIGQTRIDLIAIRAEAVREADIAVENLRIRSHMYNSTPEKKE